MKREDVPNFFEVATKKEVWDKYVCGVFLPSSRELAEIRQALDEDAAANIVSVAMLYRYRGNKKAADELFNLLTEGEKARYMPDDEIVRS